jgi:hypothetical protein
MPSMRNSERRNLIVPKLMRDGRMDRATDGAIRCWTSADVTLYVRSNDREREFFLMVSPDDIALIVDSFTTPAYTQKFYLQLKELPSLPIICSMSGVVYNIRNCIAITASP